VGAPGGPERPLPSSWPTFFPGFSKTWCTCIIPRQCEAHSNIEEKPTYPYSETSDLQFKLGLTGL
jgi:hypothetical protein